MSIKYKQFGSFQSDLQKKRSFHSFSQIEDKVLIKVSSKDFNFNLKRGYLLFYLSNNSLFSIKSSEWRFIPCFNKTRFILVMKCSFF